jgi:hypothetical protein
MKKFYLLLLPLLASQALLAQKQPDNINVNTTSFEYKYRMIPTTPQDPLLFNYGVILESTPAARDIYDDATLLRRFRIDGQNKIEEFNEDDYILEVKIGDLEIVSSNVNTTADFYTIVKYKFPVTVKLMKDGEDLLKKEESFFSVEGPTERTFNTKAFKTQKEASDYWSNNRDAIKNQIIRKELDEAVESTRRNASTKYGFFIATGKEELKTMDTKKHSENLLVQENVAELKKKLASLDATTPLAEEAVAQQIEYFKALAEKYNGRTKADLRLRYIGYYNLAQTYMLLDRPDLVIPLAEKIIANDGWPKDGERFKKDADKLMAIFLEAPYKTRQFVPQP